nr:MAG TPA: hypothetical protein [Caudoviricetes sp.]
MFYNIGKYIVQFFGRSIILIWSCLLQNNCKDIFNYFLKKKRR